MKQVAAELGISPKTASTYRVRVLEKIGATSNADLVRYALQHGVVEG
jgi:two-component system, NarL family, invasion response regulator UvrY